MPADAPEPPPGDPRPPATVPSTDPAPATASPRTATQPGWSAPLDSTTPPAAPPDSLRDDLASSTEPIGSPRNALAPPSEHVGSPNHDVASPSEHIGAPRDDLGSPRDHLASPSEHLGSPRDHLGSPRDHLGSPPEHIGSPRDHLASPSEHIGSPGDDLASRPEHIGSPGDDRVPPSEEPASVVDASTPSGARAPARADSTAPAVDATAASIGRAQPRPGRTWVRRIGRVIEAGTIVVGLGALLLWCSVPNPSRLASENPASTAFIDLRRAQAEEGGGTLKLEWQWRPIGKISRYLRAAIIYAEDYNFYRHDGVDWDAVEAAFDANWNRGALAIGGSTITQQLAKNLYLSPSRSLVRKVRELLIAYRLEDELSKQRILELYLNVVEWGDGVFGAEAAARHWFGHSVQSLSPAEAARLAIALPNPKARAPNISSTELTRKAVRIIHLLRLQGLIDPGQERSALDQVGAPDENILPSRPALVSHPPPGQPDTNPSAAPVRPDTDQPAAPDTPSPPDTGQPHERPDTSPQDPSAAPPPRPLPPEPSASPPPSPGTTTPSPSDPTP